MTGPRDATSTSSERDRDRDFGDDRDGASHRSMRETRASSSKRDETDESHQSREDAGAGTEDEDDDEGHFQSHARRSGEQRRMVDQMITLRMRLNERVHKSNARSKYLEKTLATRDEELRAARRALARAALETETLGVEANDLRRRNLPPTNALVGRLDRMSRALRRDADIADAARARAVPVTFRGAARDVRLMGDFDDWTRGFRLTPDRGDDDDRDDVFSCVCALPPGTYQVKFLIDDEEWRTTEDWETVGDGYERNMVLRVE